MVPSGPSDYHVNPQIHKPQVAGVDLWLVQPAMAMKLSILPFDMFTKRYQFRLCINPILPPNDIAHFTARQTRNPKGK